ncbi:MAG: amidohydrolase family protein, partial [Spirochaetaceae bacterium]|nr:amidohydrolase family protein [Spirochaetaceae bacterium]
DARGRLVYPPFVDHHLHLDAVLCVGDPRYNLSGTLLEGIQIWGERKKTLTKEIIKKNALKAIKWEIANGTLKIRTHADTTDPSLMTVEALVELRDEVKDLIDLQIVAFPQDGIFTSPEAETLMKKALDIGADVVGGIPHNEFTREDGVRDVLFAFDLAEKRNLLIDLHVDETGDDQSRFVEVMAKETIVRGMAGRVTASHTTAMHNYNNDYACKLLGIIKKADIHMITNPFDNSVLQNRTDGYPRRRGHTRVDELLERGINVCIGHDSIMDPWYPMGKGSMLQGANLLLHTAHLSGRDQMKDLFNMITINSAKAMNIDDYGIKAGNTADLIILDAVDESEAIRLESECLFVIRKGKVIIKTKPAERIFNPESDRERIDFKLSNPFR